MRNGFRICTVWLALVGALALRADELRLQPTDRILVLAPHPDDEVLACGGLIQEANRMHLPVRVVWLTYGDNNEWAFLLYRKHPIFFPGSVRRMGEVRHDEAVTAAQVLGVPRANLTFLGYPDFGTLNIWNAFWGAARPALRAMLTRVRAVPYDTAYRTGAPYKGEAILSDLVTIFHEFHPTKILVSHPADLNGDHRALYLFARVALWQVHDAKPPELLPYLIHFRNWPRPRGELSNQLLTPPPPLAEKLFWHSFSLTPQQIERKHMALRAHRSEDGSSHTYLVSFVRKNELFGDFPDVRLPVSSATTVDERRDEPNERKMEHLEKPEREKFVGVEREYVRREADALVFSIDLSQPLDWDVEASLYLFGYRSDRPFANMPKLHVQASQMGCAAYDQNRKLPRDVVEVQRTSDNLTLRVPLKALGNPECVLTTVRTYHGEIPFDWLAWRIIELPPATPE